MSESKLLEEIKRLKVQNEQLQSENQKFRQMHNMPMISPLITLSENTVSQSFAVAPVHKRSSPDEKIDLFMSLFCGRTDVYAKRWYSAKLEKGGYTPVCLNEWRQNVCNKAKIKCKDCPNRNLAPLDRNAIDRHLRDKSENCVVGIYPLLPDETCFFIAVDFDDEDWKKDISAFRETCIQNDVPVAIERSRSGCGGHAWVFFEEAISATIARKFGSALLTSAMALRHEIKFNSYDRMFPSQDFMPKGGLGNLIALPLQGGARLNGNSEFIDSDFASYSDQWAYLSLHKKLSLSDVERHILKLCKNGELGTLLQTSSDEITKPWESRKPEHSLSMHDFPSMLHITSANMLYIEKAGVSQKALNRIKRLAAFSNPDFYKTQAMRLSTHNKPRIIFTLDETSEYLGIPRGCESALLNLLNHAEVEFQIDDKRNYGSPINVEFLGALRDEQALAVSALLKHDNGILCATTAFGKTVVGANLIAQKKVNTLILVHTQALVSQWKNSLAQFIAIDEVLSEQLKKRGRKKEISLIGQIGAGKNTPSGIIDIAVIQSLLDGDGTKELVKDYGMVIVDECHHVSAFTFERILKAVSARFVYGLTATPTRQDGHHPIILMQCGDIRYRVDAKTQAEKRNFAHYIIPRFTSFRKPISLGDLPWAISQIYSSISEDALRNKQILEDVISAIEVGRTPIVLTERSDHVKKLVADLQKNCNNVIALTGKASLKEKREAIERLEGVSQSESLVIVATGKYVGEGFDFPRLDTLFLAMPIAWKGTVAQYAGRLHRDYDGKQEVIVYDYVDIHVGVLERMYHKRVKGYAQIGYQAKVDFSRQEQVSLIYDTNSFSSVLSSDFSIAENEIVIASPFLRSARIEQIKKWLISPFLKCAAITVLTRSAESYKEKERPTIQACIDQLVTAGIKVIQKPNVHQKFIIIDRKIIWYGSINLLSYGNAEESIMRLESHELAAELIALV